MKDSKVNEEKKFLNKKTGTVRLKKYHFICLFLKRNIIIDKCACSYLFKEQLGRLHQSYIPSNSIGKFGRFKKGYVCTLCK